MIKEPLQAATIEESDLDNLHYPLLASPKIDGIRCLVIRGQCYTRKLKPIPNKFIRQTLEDNAKYIDISLDGELIVVGSFQDIQAAVMSIEGKPQFNYKLFDCCVESEWRYAQRMSTLQATHLPPYYHILPQAIVKNKEDVLNFEKSCIFHGYEGIIIRSLAGRYKQGRSTVREEILMKLKRFVDSEAVIVGFEELISMPGSVKMNTLGSLLVKDCTTGIEFSIGSGYDEQTRANIWDNRLSNMGKVICYKYQSIGVKEKPRFPVFKGFRRD